MDNCRHPHITVYAEEDGPLRMWACSECKIRFYPACETCVTIGHRSEIHEPGIVWHDRYDDAARIMLNQADEINRLRTDLAHCERSWEDAGKEITTLKALVKEMIHHECRDEDRPFYHIYKGSEWEQEDLSILIGAMFK